jgi:hypothetical protein
MSLELHPDNEITMGMDFDSAAQASVNEINEAHSPLPIERGRRERSTACRTNREAPALSETGANHSQPSPLKRPICYPYRG